MAERKSRPQLQPPDLTQPAGQPSTLPRRVAADDPRFAAAAELETHDAYVRGVQEGRVHSRASAVGQGDGPPGVGGAINKKGWV